MTIKYPVTGIESRVLKSLIFARKLLTSGNFQLYQEFENLLAYLLDKELFLEFYNMVTEMIEQLPNFKDYCRWIKEYTDEYGTT